MTPIGLRQLLDNTQTLFGDPASFGAGLDWVDRILPKFTDACIYDVTYGSEETFTAWREWITGDSIEAIREAGEDAVFAWRRAWLEVLIDVSMSLFKAGKGRGIEAKKLSETLYSQAPDVFSFFPRAFWFDLVDLLSGNRSDTPVSVCNSSFPLVLAERMVIDGDNIDVLLADFSLSPSGYRQGGLYLDPAQVAIRCIDGQFAQIFAQAAGEVARHIAPEDLPSVRVQLTPLRPEHEIFLHTLILCGPSGGGALASGLYSLIKSYRPMPDFATSFALSGPGQSMSDGLCHAVGGAYEKVRGCAKAGLKYLVVAEEAAGQVGFYGHLQNVSIIGTAGLSDVFGYLDRSAAPAPSALMETEEDEDGGVLSLYSPLYVERKSDAEFKTALAHRPMIVLVKGARQIGKTSLLVRGVDQVRKSSAKLIYVDLQSLGRNSLKTQRDFFVAVARIFERELNLNVTMDELYDDRDGPNKNFENFLFKYVLSSPVIWFMDEVDRLFDFEYYTDVFSLMRSWHNRRSVHRELGNLTLVLCYATETHLMIQDVYQSPFNVGTKIELGDFAPDQVSAFNNRVGGPLKSQEELNEFIRLAGGHPHLVCRGLSWMAHEGKSLAEFAAVASTDSGPFGSHLRRLRLLAKNAEQVEVIQSVLRGTPCYSHDAFLHLRSAGVLVGYDLKSLRVRCGIYEEYLRRNLIAGDKGASAGKERGSLFAQLFRRLIS